MALVWNEETQQYEYEDPNGLTGPQPATQAPSNIELAGMTSKERLEAAQAQEAAVRQQTEAALTDQRVAGDDVAYQTSKPKSFLATDDDGNFSFTESVSDVFKSVVNPAAAFLTDYVDLGHGIADLVGQTGNLVMGKGFDWNEVMNDADNPLTAARLETIGADTSSSQLGEMINKTIRVGVALAAAPKFLFGGALKGIKIASLGGKFKLASKAKKSVVGAMEGYQKFRVGRNNKFMEALSLKGKEKGASDVMRLAGADSWLYGTYADVVKASANAPELSVAANWMKSTGRAAGQLTKRKAAVGTIAEALAWDVAVGFMVGGENTSFDETIFDFFDDIGIPTPGILTSDVMDSPLQSKLKGMADGLFTGAIVSAMTDVFRIARFTRAFQNASGADQAALVKAFNLEAQDLGESIAYVSEVAESATKRAATTYRQGFRRSGAPAQLPGTETIFDPVKAGSYGADPMMVADAGLLNPGQTLADYSAMVQTGKIQNQLMSERYAAQARDLKPELAAEQRAMSATGIVPYEGPGRLTAPKRPPTPTVSPMGFKKALQDELDKAMLRAELTPEQVARISGQVLSLMPTKRVDVIDYLKTQGPVYNGHGTMDLATSLRTNAFLKQGLDEGWMTVGPDMLLMYNRKMAFDYDQGDFVFKEAAAIDQADELARYRKQFEDTADPATQDVQAALDPASGPLDPDALVSNPNLIDTTPQAKSALEDPALVEATRQANASKIEQAQLKASEDEEIFRQATQDYRAEVGDDVFVSEMIGRDLTSVGQLDVAKVGNRQYQVVNELGESVDGRTYSTLKAARQASTKMSKQLKDDAVKLAKAEYQNAQNQVIDVKFERIDGETGITYKPGFTTPQLNKLAEFGITGEEVAAMNQTDMRGMLNSVIQLLEGAKGNEKRVLNGIKSKLEAGLADLDPKVRLRAELDRTMESANKMLRNGEICF